MKLPVQPSQYDRNFEQRRSSAIEAETAEIRRIADFVTTGVGAPAFTPNGRALYIRQDGGVNTTFYVFEGTVWAAK